MKVVSNALTAIVIAIHPLAFAASPSINRVVASIVTGADGDCVLPNTCAGKIVNDACACVGRATQKASCPYECTKSGNASTGIIACDDNCQPVGCSVPEACLNACGEPGLLVCAPQPNSPPRLVCKIINDVKLCFPVWVQNVCYAPGVPTELCNGIDDNCDGLIDELVCRGSTSCECVPKTCDDLKAKGTLPDGCGGTVDC